MGYNKKNTIQSNQGVGTTFMKISGEGVMRDLHMTGYGNEYFDNQITCCKLNTSGESGATMFWVDYSEGGDTWYGWYNADWDDTTINEIPLQNGEGLWLDSPSSEIQIESSGQVNAESTPVILIQSNQLIANPIALTLKMKQAWIAGYGDEYFDNQITCCKLNTSGESGALMFWVDYTEDGFTWYGWYNADWDDETINEITLTPGECIWLDSPTAGWTMNFPSAFNPDANYTEHTTK